MIHRSFDRIPWEKLPAGAKLGWPRKASLTGRLLGLVLRHLPMSNTVNLDLNAWKKLSNSSPKWWFNGDLLLVGG